MPRCPGCNTLLTRSEQETVRLHTCSNCFGNWIAHPALLRLVRGPAQAGPETPAASTVPAVPAAPPEPSLQELAAIVVESNTTKTLRCPECHVDLRKDRLHPMIPVQLDRCPKCSCLWLDVGELPLLKRLYQELRVSTDPQVVRLRDKIAQVSAQWESRERGLAEAEAAVRNTSSMGHDLSSFLRILGRV